MRLVLQVVHNALRVRIAQIRLRSSTALQGPTALLVSLPVYPVPVVFTAEKWLQNVHSVKQGRTVLTRQERQQIVQQDMRVPLVWQNAPLVRVVIIARKVLGPVHSVLLAKTVVLQL